MKKVFVVSLILVSFFIIGSSEMAWAPPLLCTDYQDYQCVRTETRYGEIEDIYTECMKLCYDDGFEVNVYGYCFECYLYPATGYKYLLGTADTCGGWSGCSVEFKGKSMVTKVTGIQNDNGYEEIYKCTPCDDCCSP